MSRKFQPEATASQIDPCYSALWQAHHLELPSLFIEFSTRNKAAPRAGWVKQRPPTGEPERSINIKELDYRTRYSWSRSRRMVAKAERSETANLPSS